jgi:ribosomal silencing factor RsfS
MLLRRSGGAATRGAFRAASVHLAAERAVAAAPRSLLRRGLSATPLDLDAEERVRRQYTVDDAVSWLHAELADELTVLDVRDVLDGLAGDWLVFATARSHAHMKRAASAVCFELKQRGVSVHGGAPTIEGIEADDGWMWRVVPRAHTRYAHCPSGASPTAGSSTAGA